MSRKIVSKKLLLWGLAVIIAVLAIAATQINLASLIASQQNKNDSLLQERMAYHVGVLAYLYGYPLVDMHKQMFNETRRVSPDQQTYAPVNRFYRFPNLVTPTTGGNFRAPNNDTLYYTAWFDISDEPLILHLPDTSGRYYTIAVTNQYAEVVHVGRRTMGTDEKYVALVAPHWQGELPDGVVAVPTETNEGWLLGRMLVDGPRDFDAAKALVDATWAASLSEFAIGRRPGLPAEKIAEAIDPMLDLRFFQIMNQQLKRLPPRPQEAALMAQFDAIGVGPNVDFDPQSLDEDVRAGLLQAIEEGAAMVQASTQRTIPDFNGWMISKDIGRYGYQYMHRASVVKGGYGNLPEESLYPAALFDSKGDLLNGSHRYRVHFAADQMPPVNGFWSLSIYQLSDLQLVDNVIDRYSIGDRTEGLHYNNDGSLTIVLQQQQPEDDNVNWMPVPAGNFAAIMRLYEPSEAALDNSYLLPRIEEIEN
jgi:hypothetical protein